MSTPRMGTRRTYVRPMGAWWQRNGFYKRYILRELTCLAVLALALELLVGVWRLSQGAAAFDAWRAALASPLAVAGNLIVLALMVYHAWTWFAIMPKTMPFVIVGGKRVSDRLIVAGAFAGWAVASIVVFVVFVGVGR